MPPPGRLPPQSHSCTICAKHFSRLSHLQRHELLHTDAPSEIFQCHVCEKRFKRKDVYQRHLRAVHGPNQAVRRTGRKKSCEHCISYKLKCSREIPCSACKGKGVPCKYDPTASPVSNEGIIRQMPIDDRPLTEAHRPWPLSLPGHQLHLRDRTFEHSHNRPDSAESSQQTWSLYQADMAIGSLLNAAESCRDPPLHHPVDFGGSAVQEIGRRPPAQPSEPDRMWAADELTLPGISADNGTYPSTYDPEEDRPFRLLDVGVMFDGSTFEASKMDWLAADATYSDRQTLSSLHLPSESPLDLNVRPLQEEATRGYESASTRSKPAMDHPPAVSDGVEGKSDWPQTLDLGGNEMWPFDYTSNRGYRKIKLPPLRQVLEDTVGHRPTIEKTTLLDLIKTLSAPQIPSLIESPALETLPAISFLTKLVKVYFEEFHPVFSVIHVPTWKVEGCPTTLLAAMACLGAAYSDAEGSSEVAVLLAEITQRALFWVGQGDTTAFRSPSYITAMCLHHTFSLGTGNRRLYELADAARGVMVTSLRGMGILSSEADIETKTVDFGNLRLISESEVDDAWAQWRSRETLKRIAWMVFEFDCNISTMTNKRGTFSISELPTRLPCMESLWEAHSAKAWASMVSFSTSPPAGVLLYPLIQELTAERATLSTVPMWAKRLCAQVVSRFLWDLKEIQDASAPNKFGINSLSGSYKATSEAMLQTLTPLNESLSNPTSTTEIVNINVACLATYCTELITRTGAMDLIFFIFRNSGRDQSPQLTTELARAKDYLRSTFAINPVDTRRSVTSASNIVSIGRECTSFTPGEVMRVFNGFAYLLAFSRFFPFERVKHTSVAVRLDCLPWRRSPQDRLALKAWFERGGQASFYTVDDICNPANFETLRQESLRAMSDLKMWGLARKFRRILQDLT